MKKRPVLSASPGELLTYHLAHHCSKNSPANKIMQNFYHPQRLRLSHDVPRILGLSASPVLSDLSTLRFVLTVPNPLTSSRFSDRTS